MKHVFRRNVKRILASDVFYITRMVFENPVVQVLNHSKTRYHKVYDITLIFVQWENLKHESPAYYVESFYKNLKS